MTRPVAETPRQAKADPDSNDKNAIQVVSRALHILRSLGRHPTGLSLAEIAVQTGYPRSTVQRLVGALAFEGFVEPLGPTGGTRLGPAVLQLVHTAHGDIVSLARPHLQELASKVKETVSLASVAGRKSVVIDRIIAERELCVMTSVGMVYEQHTTAMGRVFMATLSDDVVIKLLKTGPGGKAFTKDKLTAFLFELKETRKTGFAYDYEETFAGICFVSMYLKTNMGAYAVSIGAPTTRFNESLPLLKIELKKCALAINTRISEKTGT